LPSAITASKEAIGPAIHLAFVKEVFEAAFQVHVALAQKCLAGLALNGTSGAMKGFAQRGSQSLLATPSRMSVPNERAHIELLDLGDFFDGKVAFVRGQ
jgi:hypothetical protein